MHLNSASMPPPLNDSYLNGSRSHTSRPKPSNPFVHPLPLRCESGRKFKPMLPVAECQHPEEALSLADEIEDGQTGFLIERALDEARSRQFRSAGDRAAN